MELVRTVPRMGGFPTLYTFRRTPCEVVFTEEEPENPPPNRAVDLHLEVRVSAQ